MDSASLFLTGNTSTLYALPVIDLRAKFGMETTDVTDETCIIVVEVEGQDAKLQMGIVVDAVTEVLPVTSVDGTPASAARVRSRSRIMR